MVLGISSGLLLGWSLGANDAANVFGTAVATRMVRFATAAKLAAVFIILGGLVNGPAAMETLGALGQIDTLPGAFATALAPAVTIAVMVRLGMPVSTSQAVVGALIGYRLVVHGGLDAATWRLLWTIIFTWAACPILAAAVAFSIYKVTALTFRWLPMPLFTLDRWLRFGLVASGCYGAWALGGNNMANVVGVYARLDLFELRERERFDVEGRDVVEAAAGVSGGRQEVHGERRLERALDVRELGEVLDAAAGAQQNVLARERVEPHRGVPHHLALVVVEQRAVLPEVEPEVEPDGEPVAQRALEHAVAEQIGRAHEGRGNRAILTAPSRSPEGLRRERRMSPSTPWSLPSPPGDGGRRRSDRIR